MENPNKYNGSLMSPFQLRARIQGHTLGYSQNIDPLSGTSCAWHVLSQSFSSRTPFEPAAAEEKRRVAMHLFSRVVGKGQLKRPRALKTCCQGVDLTGSGPKRLGEWAK